LTSMMITMILKNPTVITARKRVSAVFWFSCSIYGNKIYWASFLTFHILSLFSS
jgi:hypothetical protein